MSRLSVQETVPFIEQVFIRDSLYVDLVDMPSGVQGRGRNQTKPSWGRVMTPPAYALLDGSDGKESTCNADEPSSILG